MEEKVIEFYLRLLDEINRAFLEAKLDLSAETFDKEAFKFKVLEIMDRYEDEQERECIKF